MRPGRASPSPSSSCSVPRRPRSPPCPPGAARAAGGSGRNGCPPPPPTNVSRSGTVARPTAAGSTLSSGGAGLGAGEEASCAEWARRPGSWWCDRLRGAPVPPSSSATWYGRAAVGSGEESAECESASPAPPSSVVECHPPRLCGWGCGVDAEEVEAAALLLAPQPRSTLKGDSSSGTSCGRGCRRRTEDDRPCTAGSCRGCCCGSDSNAGDAAVPAAAAGAAASRPPACRCRSGTDALRRGERGPGLARGGLPCMAPVMPSDARAIIISGEGGGSRRRLWRVRDDCERRSGGCGVCCVPPP